MNIPTPHIEVTNTDSIAKTVLMPGDPLRAKFIAENFLENPKLINSARGMLGYTGKYKNKDVSVIGSGMGIPSIGIYSYELFKFYNVDRIIRIGSCGSYSEDIKINDVLLVNESYSESTYAKIQAGFDEDTFSSSAKLNQTYKTIANNENIPLKTVKAHTSDVFYSENNSQSKDLALKQGCSAVEMESFALFSTAKLLNKDASCLLTVSDSLITGECTTIKERETSFTTMMKLALELVTKI